MTQKAVYVAKISPNTTAPLCTNTLISESYSDGGQDLGSIPGGVFQLEIFFFLRHSRRFPQIQISYIRSNIWKNILLNILNLSMGNMNIRLNKVFWRFHSYDLLIILQIFFFIWILGRWSEPRILGGVFQVEVFTFSDIPYSSPRFRYPVSGQIFGQIFCLIISNFLIGYMNELLKRSISEVQLCS